MCRSLASGARHVNGVSPRSTAPWRGSIGVEDVFDPQVEQARDLALFSLQDWGGFDVAPGLRNFLILPGKDEIDQFEVITNWFVDLGRRVPIAK